MKVAIVHEWLEHYAGSERVLEQLLHVFPDADLFAIVDFMPESERGMLGGRPVHTTVIQRLPFARKLFRNYLGLMPLAVEQLKMGEYDLVISSSHAVAKGVLTGPGQVHVSYVHSPMRYAWDLQAEYLQQGRLEHGLKSVYARWLLHKMRLWDMRTANGVDVFVANSSYIAKRIHKVYRRGSEIVHPPVDLERFPPYCGPRGGYLIASRFVPYKRVPLVVEAFARMPDKKLTVVGDGPERQQVVRAAAGAANIELLPPLAGAELAQRMAKSQAFVFAAVEDFGITMVEAQSCGTPLIALGRGGACDIVRGRDHDRPTGVLFAHQSVESIMAAVQEFEAHESCFAPWHCNANAQRFSQDAFRDKIRDVIDRAMFESATIARPIAAVPLSAGAMAAE
jgi:glycosyltransferase involved in cell wall biosynthesis